MIDNITSLLKTPWGAEQWINEGWNTITSEEKEVINARMALLFSEGLPFEIKHDKQLYIYAFSFLAQLEVLAIQIPLKFEKRLSQPDFQRRMRQQLLDELFHGLVFTKIVYMLSQPFAYPPAYNDQLESLCNFIRQETCPKIAIRLLNLVAEGWIEEIFSSFAKHKIAPKVFNTILEDESRHVSEADLYLSIGLPEHDRIQLKIAALEKLLLRGILLEGHYVLSLSSLLGVQGWIDFLYNLDKKHNHQLQKIGLTSSDYWQFHISSAKKLIPQIERFSHLNTPITMTPMRQILMTQWDNPTDPSMVGEFDIDISPIDFFQNKHPRETSTLVILKALSQMVSTEPVYRQFLINHQLFRSEQAYIGLVVKLPECHDHLGTIAFENAHLYTIDTLRERIHNILEFMTICYKKREALEKAHPYLVTIAQKKLLDTLNAVYRGPLLSNAVISLSNIGSFGYQRSKSPLRKNEAMKFTLMEIQRKPHWNNDKQQFEPKDFMPVSCSADHRIFDGNIPLPKLLRQHAADIMKKIDEPPASKQFPAMPKKAQLNALFNKLESQDERILHGALTILQTYWLDFVDLTVLLNPTREEQFEVV